MGKVTFADKTQVGAYEPAKLNAKDINDLKAGVNELYDTNFKTIVSEEITISHVLNTKDEVFGLSTASLFASPYVGIGGTPPVFSVEPATGVWNTLHVLATAFRVRFFTNIVDGDVLSPYAASANGIAASLIGAYQSGPSEASNVGMAEVLFSSVSDGDGWNANKVTGGTLSSPVKVGDIGTHFHELDISESSPATARRLGKTTTYGNAFFTYFFKVNAVVPTKDFKFRIEIDYI